jgi:hypothetical protein
MGEYGRPVVLGVRLEINPQQAVIVERIFRMYADGSGLRNRCAAEHRGCVWPERALASRYTIHEMLSNERYRGVNVWGRTQKAHNPEMERKVCRETRNRSGAGSRWRSGVSSRKNSGSL